MCMCVSVCVCVFSKTLGFHFAPDLSALRFIARGRPPIRLQHLHTHTHPLWLFHGAFYTKAFTASELSPPPTPTPHTHSHSRPLQLSGLRGSSALWFILYSVSSVCQHLFLFFVIQREGHMPTKLITIVGLRLAWVTNRPPTSEPKD